MAKGEERAERLQAYINDRDYPGLMDALFELGTHGRKHWLVERGEGENIEAAAMSLEQLKDLLGLPHGEQDDAQAKVLLEVAQWGDAAMGAAEVGVPLAEVERWEKDDVRGWRERERLALRLYEGRLKKLLLKLSGTTKGNKNTQAVVKLLEATNPERWARARRLDDDRDLPFDELLKSAQERNRHVDAADAGASPYFQ